MTKYITKRNGNKVEFDISKIENAVFRAACDVAGTLGWTGADCHEVAEDIANDFILQVLPDNRILYILSGVH